MMSMQNQKVDKKQMMLTVVLPDKPPERVACDYVKLTVKDSLRGKNGGSYGIMSCHTPSVFLLEAGITEAFFNGESIWKRKTGDGFARVEENNITVVTES